MIANANIYMRTFQKRMRCVSSDMNGNPTGMVLAGVLKTESKAVSVQESYWPLTGEEHEVLARDVSFWHVPRRHMVRQPVFPME